MRGNEGDKYPCEKHYSRKEVTSCHVSDIATGAFIAVGALCALNELS